MTQNTWLLTEIQMYTWHILELFLLIIKNEYTYTWILTKQLFDPIIWITSSTWWNSMRSEASSFIWWSAPGKETWSNFFNQLYLLFLLKLTIFNGTLFKCTKTHTLFTVYYVISVRKWWYWFGKLVWWSKKITLCKLTVYRKKNDEYTYIISVM